MLYPSIDKLLKVVDSKYSLAIVSAKRSKEMSVNESYQLPLTKYKNQKNIGKALEEIYQGLIIINNDN